jgi:hypothetical protein
MALREGGGTATNGRRPRSGRDSDRADPVIRSRSGDPAAGDITSLTDLRVGTGPKLVKGQKVTVHYTGYHPFTSSHSVHPLKSLLLSMDSDIS